MPNVKWLVFDNFASAQACTDRIGVWCMLCDDSGSYSWGPVYEDLDAPGGAKYAVEHNSTLMLNPTTSKTWSCAATAENNHPANQEDSGVYAAIDDPLLSAEALAHLAWIEFRDFVEHDYTPAPPPDA